jgi:hypothetical protein
MHAESCIDNVLKSLRKGCRMSSGAHPESNRRESPHICLGAPERFGVYPANRAALVPQQGGLMFSKRLSAAAVAAVTLMGIAAGPANSAVVIDITQSGGNVDVTVTGDLNLEGATLINTQTAYSAGIIPGGDNWYVTAGAIGGQDLYELTGATLPFGTSGYFYGTGLTLTGDAFIIWGNHGGTPIVGVPTGYTSGASISSFMEISGETIAGMTLIPGSYTFDLPNDTITLEIAVPEPATWAMMLLGFAGLGLAGYRRARTTISAT